MRVVDWLADAPAVRVVQVPRPAEAQRASDPGFYDRRTALVAAYHAASATETPLFFGWQRMSASGPVRLLVAGAATGFGRAPVTGRQHVGLPPGGQGVPLAPGVLSRSLAALPCWSPISVVHDVLSMQDADPGRGYVSPSIDRGLLAAWDAPFGLVLIAEPVSAEDAAAAAYDVAGRLRDAKNRADASPDHQIAVERLTAQHRELHQASEGLWRLKVLAGAFEPDAARRVAALAVASFDLRHVPYVVHSTPDAPVAGFSEITATAPNATAPPDLLAALAKPPAREINGLHHVQDSEFDLNLEPGSGSGPVIEVGEILDRLDRPTGPLSLPLDSLNRHTFVCGATGAGKSQTVRALLETAAREGPNGKALPWLVIEPAKAEYRLMADRLAGTADVIVIRPGDPGLTPAGINPLEPIPGFPLQTHLDLVKTLFLASFDAEEPFPQVLGAALDRSYRLQGWDVALGGPAKPGTDPRWPTLADLEHAALEVVESIGYGREVSDNIRGFVKVRLASLRLGATGRFLEGGFRLDFARLVRRNVVLEIEDVGDDREKAFLIGVMLIALTEHLRTAGPADGLRHLTVIEEAHRLLRRTETGGAGAQALEMFASLLAEVRAYGEGLVIAEQIPAKLVPDVIKNTAVKIVHRLPAQDDRDTVGATMNLSENQSKYLVTLPPGTAAVFADGMDNPVLARMPDGTSRERGVAKPVDPEVVVDPAFGRCAANYGLLGVSSRTLLRGKAALERRPILRLWAELELIAHVMGRPGVTPLPEVYASLDAIPRGLRHPALAYAVDEAVACRSFVLHRHVDCAELAAHLMTALNHVAHRNPPCRLDEARWLAGPFRWERVYALLRQADPDAGPHPNTRAWYGLYRERVDGQTIGEQLAWVRARRVELDDPYAKHGLLFGEPEPSFLERQVEMLGQVTDLPWFKVYLTDYSAGG